MSLTILLYVLVGFIVLLLVWMARLEIRLKRILMGTKGENLEQAINILREYTEKIRDAQGKINEHLETVDGRLNKTIRRVEAVRFNPFEDHGSNQSFAIAFMNDENDGVIISSLYARDRMSIFAKPIKNGKSEFELSAEEKEVLGKAK